MSAYNLHNSIRADRGPAASNMAVRRISVPMWDALIALTWAGPMMPTSGHVSDWVSACVMEVDGIQRNACMGCIGDLRLLGHHVRFISGPNWRIRCDWNPDAST